MKLFRVLTLLVVLYAMVMPNVQARMRNVPLLNPDRVEMKSMNDEAVTLDRVRKAILMGSQPYGWVVEQDDAGVMRLSHSKQDKHKAVVRVDYDQTGYKISYDSSVNLYYEKVDGVATIHPTYNMWVRNLLVRIVIPGELAPASAVKRQ